MNHDDISHTTRRWVDQFVVELNLCPFAARELNRGSVRFSVTDASTEECLLLALHDEITLLASDAGIETTLLIHPAVLQRFEDYNQFLDLADALLLDLGFEGTFQIASFHPDYQFADTEPDDAENFTNRSPYPMLHLLREASLSDAVDRYPDVDQIPGRNVQTMQRLGTAQLLSMVHVGPQTNRAKQESCS